MINLLNTDSSYPGIYRVKVIDSEKGVRVYIPGISHINPFDKDGNLNEDTYEKHINAFPLAQWCAYNLESCDINNIVEPMWCMFECGDAKRPVIISYTVVGGGGEDIDSTASGTGGVSSGGNGTIEYNKFIIVGDSRTVQLVNTQFSNGSSIPSNEIYICLGGMGHRWFAASNYVPGGSSNHGYDKNNKKAGSESWNVIQSITDSISSGCAIVLLMGANDAGQFAYNVELDKYSSQWKEKGADIYFFSVGKMGDYRNNSVIKFNTQLKDYCSKNKDVIFYDLYEKIPNPQYGGDTVHYASSTYKEIHDHIIGLRGGSAAVVNGEITLEWLQKNCKNKQEYLDVVMPIFKEYCAHNEHNVLLKYPGVLALQPFYEVSANFPQETSNVCRLDNNLGGLKYSSRIPRATKGTAVPSNETGGCYCHFKNVSDYYYAQVWNATSSTYSLSHRHQSSVTDYARTFLNKWVPGRDGTGPVAYSESLLKDYNTYNLSKYEN